MVKLFITEKDRKRFQDFFRFLIQNECELAIFPEGLKWRNHQADGIIYKEAFSEYPFNYRRKLGVVGREKKVNLTEWFKNWKEIDNNGVKRIEIPIGS